MSNQIMPSVPVTEVETVLAAQKKIHHHFAFLLQRILDSGEEVINLILNPAEPGCW
jgi:hypothetical protein